MRLVGELSQDHDPKVLEDHLLSLGVKSRFDQRPEGWAVWIIDEDQVAQGREELRSYLDNPDDPRFRESAKAAREIRRKEAELDKQFRKNEREAAKLWGPPTFWRRPATTILTALAITVFVMQRLPMTRDAVLEWLGFFSLTGVDPAFRSFRGLTDVLSGQIWRLVTPILLHFSLLHILFNLWWTSVLGTAIELRRGTGRFLALVLISAVLSNLTEYFYMDQIVEKYAFFGGLSGVVYALFGYVWMKGESDPEAGLGIDSRTVVLMLVWLVLCMTGLLGPVANGAHLGGLAVGMVLGLLRF